MDDYEATAYRLIVERRIRDLWESRAWFRSHLGWIPQERTDQLAELRYLVKLAREARKAARAAQEHHDAYTRAKALAWRGDHFAGMPS